MQSVRFSLECCYNIGGGWTLVVTISSTNNDHLESAKVNCLNLELCVPLPENDITARKLQDIDIHELLHSEGNAVESRNFKENKSKLYQNLRFRLSKGNRIRD